MNHVYTKTALLLGLALLPQLAYAHLVETRFGEFYSGLLHPLTTLIHVVAWLALGFLAGFQTLKEARKILVLFPLAVVLGAIFANFFDARVGSAQANLDYVNLASIVILGTGVIWAKNLPSYVVLGIAVFFGLTHGMANANANLSANGQILYLAGIMVAAYLLVCLASAGVVLLTQKHDWGKTAVRALGSWILAVGIIFSGFSLLTLSV